MTPAQDRISVKNGYPPPETVVGVEAPLVRYLLEQLITQRLENAQLHADLAAAAERAGIEKAAGETDAALAAWIIGPPDKLGQGEAQPAFVSVTRASGGRLLREARAPEVSAGVSHQVASMKTKLKELERQIAIVQSVAERLAERLGGADADLKLRYDDNERLTGELGTPCISAQYATLLPPLNAAPIENLMETLPDWQEPAGLVSATSLEMAPIMPHPKPRLRASNVEAWTRADVAGQDTGATPVAASESLDKRNIMSESNSSISGTLMRTESRSTGLARAAARLADGLRATRKEAIFRQQERVFSVDVNRRAFASSAGEFVPLDPALDISLLTAKSELVGGSTGGIRFFPDGSSTGGQIELGLLGNRTAVNVQWSTGAVTLER